MDEKTFYDSLPKKRMASGALILNKLGELLIVKPTYRDHWLVPGGAIEADESPRQACEREVLEEIGLSLSITRLLCVDYRSRDGDRSENIQFIFDGGVLMDKQIQQIVLPPDELSQYTFVPYIEAARLLNTRLAQRISYALPARGEGRIVYLEEGVPLEG